MPATNSPPTLDTSCAQPPGLLFCASFSAASSSTPSSSSSSSRLGLVSPGLSVTTFNLAAASASSSSGAAATAASAGVGKSAPPTENTADNSATAVSAEAAAAANRPHIINNLLAPNKRHFAGGNSPSPSPLTPTIEALLWKIDLVDQAGCDLAVIDEEDAAAAHKSPAALAANAGQLVETPTSALDQPTAAAAAPPSAAASARVAQAAEAELVGSRRSSDSSTTSSISTDSSDEHISASAALRREVVAAAPSPMQATGKPPLAERRRSRSNSHSELAKTAVGLRHIARKIGRAQLIWDHQPQTVLLVTKIHDEQLIRITHQVAKWLAQEMGLTVLVEDRMENDPVFNLPGLREQLSSADDASADKSDKIRFWNNEFCASADGAASVDFLITLGGDGTVLYAAWLFQQKCPPIIPFRLGSLGFLTTFDFSNFRKSVSDLVLGPGLQKGLRMNFRMRFSCTVVRHDTTADYSAHGGGAHGETFEILNDLTIDRGPSPFMSQLELYGNENHLTTIHADGLTISTPTGSTAYSLSSGGSLVHPDVSAILVTPICPHTLSFRPMILPDTMEVRIAVPEDSRATAFASFDGRKRVCLGRGDAVVVRAGVWPVPTVCWEDQSKDWFKGLERCLGWNKRERQKGLVGGGETGMDGIPW
ncbi:hypothetical protein HDU87_002595 [Geranomyces variabilis]|uniref:Uncharacterized protein n=1 Tax=Geranomyces variabilis TaxID=109894 RepID=A0AAD5XUQ9_9FUNG|nr:hypothetical protein HDU87_002595 [Geranomyces variabilis]